MTYHIILKEKIIRERKKGASLNEIHKKTGISKGTLSLWLKDIKLSHAAEMILLKKIKRGQYISAEKKKKKNKKDFIKLFS